MCCSLQYLLPNLSFFCSLKTCTRYVPLFIYLKVIQLFYKAKTEKGEPVAPSNIHSHTGQYKETVHTTVEGLLFNSLRTITALDL